MIYLKWFAGILPILIFAGCTTMQVSHDYNSNVDFSKLHTFNWVEGEAFGTQPYSADAITNSRIINAVVNQLAIKGYKEEKDEVGDFLIAYHISLEEKIEISTIDEYYVGGFGHRPLMGGSLYGRRSNIGIREITVDRYIEGTLILDIIDAQTKELIWRGTAQSEVNPSDSAEVKEKRIHEAVTQMLNNFPPIS